MPDWLCELVRAYPFPDPPEGSKGLLAWGGDLRPERLIAGYAQGVFAWYDHDPILWHSPDPRMLLLPEELVVNRSLAKSLRRGRQQIRFDTDFEAVVRGCAEAPRPGQSGTWITPEMITGYCELHELGLAHSAEAWQAGELVAGVYGVALGAAFFAESMFTLRGDASKVAFVTLVRRLERWGFHFVDCQVHTDHSARLGARERPRARFLELLARALEAPTRRGPWRDDAEACGRLPAMDASAKSEIERVIEGDDPDELLALLIELALSGDDPVFAQDCCLRLACHPNVEVRGNAVLGLGHLARRFGALDRAAVVAAVETALRDSKAHVRDQAEAAAEDLEQHLGWRIARPR